MDDDILIAFVTFLFRIMPIITGIVEQDAGSYRAVNNSDYKFSKTDLIRHRP